MDKGETVSGEAGPRSEFGGSPGEDAPRDAGVITYGPVTAVSELIDLSESLISQRSLLDGSPKRWAFRGQPKAFGTLVPSFQRQFSRRSIGTAEIIEHRLIWEFRKHYAELRDRSADMPEPEKIGQNSDLRCLSVMQHYDIPTRLLDWTSNFWTAIYFACASDAGKKAELWCYDRDLFERQRGMEFSSLLEHSANPPPEPPFLDRRREELIVELDPQITPRMKQQEAHHTVSTNAFGDHAPLLSALLKDYPLQSVDVGLLLRRILIDGPCKSKALQFLAEEKKISASTIFPDVVGLGRFLRWQFDSLRTMLL